MDNTQNNHRLYCCNVCNKNYKSYKSLWNHNKTFHNTKEIIGDQKYIIPVQKEIINKPNEIHNNIKCKFCNKTFSFNTNKYRHEKSCKEKEIQNNKLILKIKEQETEILKLKLKLHKSKSADIVTVKQINKLLTERHNQYQQYINNINNGTINNYNGNCNVVNNIQLIGFGNEDNIIDRLTHKEKKLILNSKYKSLEKLIEIVHCGNYNEFKNILVTNANNKYAYTYNKNKNQFELAIKDEAFTSLIDNRIYELETIYDSFLEENKLDDKTKDIIEKLINQINDDTTKYTDSEGNIHTNYKHYKIEQVKLIFFNNAEKMMNDITILLTTTNVNPVNEITV